MKAKWGFRLLAVLLVAALFLAPIGTGSTLRTAHAAPMNTGVFFVNTTDDTNTADFYLSLREAIMLANGGNGPNGINRTLTPQEEAQVWGPFSGCNSDLNGTISLCGEGYPDVIRFSNTIGSNPVIALVSMLPALNDNASTTLDGEYSSMFPTIDASGSAAISFGLSIGTGNVVKGVRVTGAALFDYNVYGSNNQLTNIAAWRAGQNGIDIRTSGNTVDGALVGVANSSVTSCGSGSANKGNGQVGIYINTNGSFPTAQHNIVKNSRISCNGKSGTYPGIELHGSGVTLNTVGPNNLIGAQAAGGATDVGNTGNGVTIYSADSNSIFTNTIANNGQNGVSISGSDSTRIGGNTIRLNSLDGVHISGNAQNNLVGGPSILAAITGNNIGANSAYGVSIVGSQARYNLLAGNTIGTTSDGNSSDPNHYSGVLVDGAHDNYIGDGAAALNAISGNLQSGVMLSSAAARNSVAHNHIGVQLNSYDPLPNSFYGIVLNTGATDNTIGGNNAINHNGLTGILIQGSTTATNTVYGNYVESNGGNGIALRDGTFNNSIGATGNQDAIDGNTLRGIELTNGSHNNTITSEYIATNGQHGIALNGSGTSHNMITGTEIIYSTGDAINVTNNAANNVWSHLSTGANDGKAINYAAYAGTLPEVLPAIHVGMVTTVTGHADGPTVFSTNLVEVYLARLNPHGYPELTYWGSAKPDISGSFLITRTGALINGTGLCFVALQTTTTSFLGTYSNSSPLGPDSCRMMLPLVIR